MEDQIRTTKKERRSKQIKKYHHKIPTQDWASPHLVEATNSLVFVGLDECIHHAIVVSGTRCRTRTSLCVLEA